MILDTVQILDLVLRHHVKKSRQCQREMKRVHRGLLVGVLQANPKDSEDLDQVIRDQRLWRGHLDELNKALQEIDIQKNGLLECGDGARQQAAVCLVVQDRTKKDNLGNLGRVFEDIFGKLVDHACSQPEDTFLRRWVLVHPCQPFEFLAVEVWGLLKCYGGIARLPFKLCSGGQWKR
ncbi:hypothetical protein F5H01DRAFT_333446 [Linnemannia elongata]|nr:hypothetical protein F5H01DRAFT_333446 [Linnemannia elongata]